jgi:hypothetical protein
VRALDELQFRRKGLAVSAVIIFALVIGLIFKIRQMERRAKSGGQNEALMADEQRAIALDPSGEISSTGFFGHDRGRIHCVGSVSAEPLSDSAPCRRVRRRER